MAIEEIMRSGSKRQTILIASLVIPATFLLFMTWFLFIRMPYEPAFTKLQTSDAAAIVEELDRLKVPHRLEDQGATILIPKDQIDQARITILGGDLPLKGAVGFELFNKSDMGLTEFAQKINYQRALQGELARTIMALDEVETARVHISLPETGIFERDRQAAKASITVATKTGGMIDNAAVQGIQQLVSSAVPNLQVGNVAVLDAHGRLLSQMPPMAANPWAQGQQRSAEEQMFAARIQDAIRSAGLSMPLKVDAIAFEAEAPNREALDSSEGSMEAQGLVAVRRAPIKIIVTLGAEPGATVRERLLAAARQAVHFDASLGDVIEIEIDPALAAMPLLPPTKPVAPILNPPSTSGGSPSGVPLWAAGAAVVLLLIIAAAIRRNRVASGLSVERRDAFAAKLKALLEEEEGGSVKSAG